VTPPQILLKLIGLPPEAQRILAETSPVRLRQLQEILDRSDAECEQEASRRCASEQDAHAVELPGRKAPLANGPVPPYAQADADTIRRNSG
jgi:hypothetical protein